MADQLPSPPCKPKPTLVTLDSDILIQLLCNLRDARNKLKPTSKSTSKHPLDPISRTCKHLRLLSLPYLYSEIFVREEEREKKVKWVNATNKLKRLNAEDVFILKYVRYKITPSFIYHFVVIGLICDETFHGEIQN